jgi:NAD(P) transhydrogenase subunit alpha
MKIAVRKESAQHEKRVALTPDVAKKLIGMGYTIVLEKDAGKEAGIPDASYEKVGVTVTKNIDELLKDTQIILQVSPPSEEDIVKFPKKSHLISLMRPHSNPDLLKKMAEQEISSFALELIPRISRAQSMDVLSSQSNLAGYRAVIEAASEFGRAMPMMMTAAGTIPPARVLVLGAGVAGLQAIATAKRLGALVTAFDVRKVAKEQVESLGATFVEVDYEEAGEGTGGYAKEMSDAYKKRQEEKLAEVIKDRDIVISTALIPGKTAPILITEAMVKSMKPGSVIVDLAVEAGGNCVLSEPGKVITKHGVKIIGHLNIPSRIPYDASQVYAKNILNFFGTIFKKENDHVDINLDDEIVKGTLLTYKGEIVHPNFK